LSGFWWLLFRISSVLRSAAVCPPWLLPVPPWSEVTTISHSSFA